MKKLFKEAISAIPAVEMDRAKQFYANLLGEDNISTLSESLGMYLVFVGEGSRFLLYKRDEPNKAEHTAMSFTAENIEETLIELENLGIKFYESDGQKIFDLDGSRSAWFKDTEGNNLEISQRS